MTTIRREDGSWLFDGMIQIDELKDYLDIDELPDEEEGDYDAATLFMFNRIALGLENIGKMIEVILEG